MALPKGWSASDVNKFSQKVGSKTRVNSGGSYTAKDTSYPKSSYGITKTYDLTPNDIAKHGGMIQGGGIYDATTGSIWDKPQEFGGKIIAGAGYQAPVEQLMVEEEYPQQEQFDPTEYINEMKAAQRASRIASLDKARSAALSSLEDEKAAVAPTYYDKRNEAAARSDVGAMNFAQYMAARGIKGAAGAMPEVYRNAGLQGQIGALDRQEAANLAAIERQRANVETGYQSDMAAAEADVESQAMEMLINQWNADRAYKLQQAAQELNQSRFDWSKSSSNPDYQASIAAARAAELANAAREIENSYLPDTLKLQAQRLKQQVDAGQYDADQALAQLNQIKAQTANYWRDAKEPYSSGSEASSQKAMNDWVTKQVAADERLNSDYSNYQQLYDAWKTMYINNMYGG